MLGFSRAARHDDGLSPAPLARPEGHRPMKRLSLLLLPFVALPLLTLAGPGTRQDQWKKVQEAIDKGLPRTAIQHLEPIIAAAIKDKAYPEAIKAIAKKIAYEGNIEGNKPEERITRMKQAIAKVPAEMVP